MSGKRLTFVVIGGIFLLSTNAANAEESRDKGNLAEELTQSVYGDRYDFRNDPYLLNLVLLGEKEETTRSPIEKTPEEKILEKWREKQAKKWDVLPKEKFVINASAYTAATDECGKNNGVTSSGLKVEEKRTLACPPEFPFGTKVSIEGFGVLRCEDRGGAIKGNHFDIYMETKREAFAFGRKNLVAEVVFD